MSRNKRDDFDDDLARSARRAGRRTLMIVLLLGGAGLALLACVACGVGGYLWYASVPAITGRWELTNQPFIGSDVRIDFRSNGTGTIQGRGINLQFDYTLSRDQPPQLEWRITRSGKFAVGPHGNIEIRINNAVLVGAPVERFHATLLADSLILTNQNGAGLFTLRRVR